jgi:hypothetical protein
VRAFHLVNAISATISRAESDRLRGNPAVQAVVPDLAIPRPVPAAEEPPATAGAGAPPAAAPSAAELQQLCPPDPAVPLLEPEALQRMNVEFQPGSGLPAAHDLVDGTGVKVAFIADGVDPRNPDFQRGGASVFADYQDFTGEGVNAVTAGAEAFGDAASIAAQGNQVYDLSRFVNAAHPLPSGCGVALRLRDPDYNLTGILIDPAGEPIDEQSTGLVTGGVTAFGTAMQFLARRPRAGRWTLVLALNAPLSGARVAEPFSGTIDFGSVPVSAAGVPGSAATRMAAGQPVTASVAVTNTGIKQKDFFVDARLATRASVALAGATPLTVRLPLLAGQAAPSVVVPTDTDQLTIVSTASAPILMHVAHVLNGPQAEGVSAGDVSIALHGAPEVASGPWTAFPTEVGPFGDAPAPAVPVSVAAVASTSAFDPAVTASSGDAWLRSVNPSAAYMPLTLAPGASGTITVTFTPNASAGTVVRGTLELDTFDPLTSMGDEVVSIPYAYTVA